MARGRGIKADKEMGREGEEEKGEEVGQAGKVKCGRGEGKGKGKREKGEGKEQGAREGRG